MLFLFKSAIRADPVRLLYLPGFLSTNFKDNFFAFVENLDIPKLSFEESMSLESDLTFDEIKNVLKSFQNNKSPGEDGFSKEFYETFFDLIGIHLLNLYNEAFTKGQLSISQRRGVICLIPKDDSCLIELTANPLKHRL